MIFLEFHNSAVEDLLLTRFSNAKAGFKFEKIDYTVADFDRVLYRIHNPEGDKSKLLVSLLVNFFDELKEYDVEGLLRREYGAYILDEPYPGYSVTLCFDLQNVPEDCEVVARHVAMLKRNCFAAVFEPFFLLQALADEPIISKRAVIHYSPDEAMYVQALEDRITVIFSTVFKDADDVVIGKIFMQELTEVRRRYDRAPQVLYSHREPPAELRDTDAVGGDNRAYITFVLFPRHLAPHSADRSINLIHTVRNYLHYHIKCAKGYLQLRMRAKTSEFIKILNRAVPHQQQQQQQQQLNNGEESAEPAVFVHALGLESSRSQIHRQPANRRGLASGNAFSSENMLMPSTLSQSDFACLQKFEDSEDEREEEEDGVLSAPLMANSIPPSPCFDA
ncbi:Actin-related protein 2/3 complex subunit 2 [Echinococcus granulosus]|uniref:Arp2/3 complex 34 kDa subunit n=1 Tax=Echinococcus granulosus TaxID=6210 RepID=A0A068WRY5_ECHGR|nr:Actin-related protein 2/3 complex subunit 2 [Echinococcus granulosus]CDS20392.1 expressed protein [Echinococcus granulosus]